MRVGGVPIPGKWGIQEWQGASSPPHFPGVAADSGCTFHRPAGIPSSRGTTHHQRTPDLVITSRRLLAASAALSASGSPPNVVPVAMVMTADLWLGDVAHSACRYSMGGIRCQVPACCRIMSWTKMKVLHFDLWMAHTNGISARPLSRCMTYRGQGQGRSSHSNTRNVGSFRRRATWRPQDLQYKVGPARLVDVRDA
jgi:hypothetical protein